MNEKTDHTQPKGIHEDVKTRVMVALLFFGGILFAAGLSNTSFVGLVFLGIAYAMSDARSSTGG